MTLQLPPTKDLGLRHLLEAGLALIGNEAVAESRRGMILNGLIELFTDAERGSVPVQMENLLFATEQPEQRSAFERYSLFFQYLGPSLGPNLPMRLAETRETLGQLRDRKKSDEAHLARARDLIRDLIAAIKHDSAFTPLEAPRTLQFG